MDFVTDEYITTYATEIWPEWSRDQIAKFHAFNPNGLVAEKRKNDDAIFDLVDAGLVPVDWIDKYGSRADYETEKMYKVAKHHRVGRDSFTIATRMLKRQIADTKARIEIAKSTNEKLDQGEE